MGKGTCLLLSSIVFICGCKGLQSRNGNDGNHRGIAPLESRDVNDLKPPGYWDIGVGYAFLENTNESGSDASGFMFSLKGYPFGRWYSTARDDVVEKDESGLSGNLSGAGAPASDEKTIARRSMQLGKDVEVLRRTEKYVVSVNGRSRDTLLNRLSVYYGISSEDFEGGDDDCTVHSIGIGIDVTPEFALIAGVGMYNAGCRDRDMAFLFGVSLNLHAFGSLIGGALGQ